jgi:hypothetical protein
MTTENEKYLQGELSSLAIECRRKKEFNDNEGLEVLATATKRTSLLGLQTHFPWIFYLHAYLLINLAHIGN